MGDIRHRIGLGTVGGSSLSGKNNIAQGGILVRDNLFTADNTTIRASSTIRTADETNV
jgi:hypothetical protein